MSSNLHQMFYEIKIKLKIETKGSFQNQELNNIVSTNVILVLGFEEL